MKTRVFKVGDYVETSHASAGVEPGEQGIIIDDSGGQTDLGLMFPARRDLWGEDRQRLSDGQYGWLVDARYLKLVYRPRGG